MSESVPASTANAESIPPLPSDLADAQAQAKDAVQAAIAAGYTRILVDILVSEIKPEVLAKPFISLCDPPFALLFSDAGAAALAQREWTAQQGLPEGILLQGVSTRVPVTEDMGILFVQPSVYTIDVVEKLCDTVNQPGKRGRPAILLNPQLQDAATVGVGLAGRRLRERFINTFEPCYHLRALPTGAVTRFYPHPWCIWQQDESGDYVLLETRSTQPTGEDIADAFEKETTGGGGFLAGLRRFIQALQR